MDFRQRLLQACHESLVVPQYGKGQQTFIAGELGVSQEAVRKWLAGETVPRMKKSIQLAELLGVKHSWLMLGTAHGEIEHDIKTAKRHAAGVYGFMAFLENRGVGARFLGKNTKGDVSFILNGKQFEVAVEVAQALDDTQTKWKVKFTQGQLEAKGNITFIELDGTPYSVAGYFLLTPSDVVSKYGQIEGRFTSLPIDYDTEGKVFRVGNMILKKVLS